MMHPIFLFCTCEVLQSTSSHTSSFLLVLFFIELHAAVLGTLLQMGVTDPLTLVQSRSVVDILKESLEDQPLADMHRTMSSMDGEQSNGQRDVATCDQVRTLKCVVDFACMGYDCVSHA